MAHITPDLHFHDLRHTGGNLAAATGASLKELMARLGHSSTRAALIYQHATRDHDQAIAEALGDLARHVSLAASDAAHVIARTLALTCTDCTNGGGGSGGRSAHVPDHHLSGLG
jgi:hypothetical protein